MFAEAVRSLLAKASGIEVTGVFHTAGDALKAAGNTQFDVAVLDIQLSGETGIDLIPRLKELAPYAGVLMLSMYNHGVFVRRAMDQGAKGYVLKGSSIQELIQAIETVARGETFLPDQLKNAAGLGRKIYTGTNNLSKREQEVLEQLCQGKMLKEIGQDLGISENAVNTYRSRLMVKLNVQTRADLIKVALESGMIK